LQGTGLGFVESHRVKYRLSARRVVSSRIIGILYENSLRLPDAMERYWKLPAVGLTLSRTRSARQAAPFESI
jgi:hypothetical protein